MAGAAALAGGVGPDRRRLDAWASTYTRALHLSGTLLGRTPSDKRLEISAVLPLRNRGQINRLIEARTILSHRQYTTRVDARCPTSPPHDNWLGLASYDFYSLYNKTNPATVESGPLGPTYVPAANPSPVKGFRDITLGTDGGCVARAGYDYCTGIGSLQSAALSGAL